ncbi:MAG: hypothetical protein U0U70_14065 [Chitinophagaceae bacterium]
MKRVLIRLVVFAAAPATRAQDTLISRNGKRAGGKFIFLENENGMLC